MFCLWLPPPRFDNHKEFVAMVRELRLRELVCEPRMAAVRCGLASVVPLQLLNILTARDLDLRVCGIPDIDLDYLKVRAPLSVVSSDCVPTDPCRGTQCTKLD